MKRSIVPVLPALVILLAIATAAAPGARADNVRATNPQALSLEVLGRGLWYSVDFDYALGEDAVAGLGLGTISAGGDTATTIPAYLSYYFAREAGSLFATAGATVLTRNFNGRTTSAADLEFSSSPVLPTFGAGYEYRSDAGLMFRLTGYGIVAKSVKPWVGFAFGYSF
jgi:hypothetical protein